MVASIVVIVVLIVTGHRVTLWNSKPIRETPPKRVTPQRVDRCAERSRKPCQVFFLKLGLFFPFTSHFRWHRDARMTPRVLPGMTPVDFLIVRHGQTSWNKDGIIQGQADAPLDAVGLAQAAALANELAAPADSVRKRRTTLPTPQLPIVTSDLSRALDTASVLADAIAQAQAVDRRATGGNSGSPDKPNLGVSKLIANVETTGKLRERHVGRLQGSRLSEARAKDPKAWNAFRSKDDRVKIPNDGESYDDVWDRAVGFVEELAGKRARHQTDSQKALNSAAAADNKNDTTDPKKPPNQPTALVTHGGVARVLLDRCDRDVLALQDIGERTERTDGVDELATSNSTLHENENDGNVKPRRVRRPGVVPNCSVGWIRVHVSNDTQEEQLWETVVWGENSFLTEIQGDAEDAAGADYA